ncbi:unnamed protein product [Leuciscus chuanchicus]
MRNLDAEAAKCRKLTEIFSSTASSSTSQLNISSSEEVSQTAMQQHATSDDEGQNDELVPQADTGQIPVLNWFSQRDCSVLRPPFLYTCFELVQPEGLQCVETSIYIVLYGVFTQLSNRRKKTTALDAVIERLSCEDYYYEPCHSRTIGKAAGDYFILASLLPVHSNHGGNTHYVQRRTRCERGGGLDTSKRHCRALFHCIDWLRGIIYVSCTLVDY